MEANEDRHTRPYFDVLVSATLAASGIAVFVGAAYSTLFTPLWSKLLAHQLGYVAIFTALACCACVAISRRHDLQFRSLLGALFVAVGTVLAGLIPVLAVAVVLGAAVLIGLAIWRPLEDADRPALALLTSVGLAVFAAILTITARFPVNIPAFYGAVALAPYGLLMQRDVRASAHLLVTGCLRSFLRPAEPAPQDRVADAGFCILTFVLCIHYLFVLLPERYYDALVTHLYVPSFMAAHARWLFDVQLWAFAHMPLTVDFLYSFLFAFAGEAGARLFNFAAFLLICALLFDLLKRLTGTRAAVWTVILFATTPLTLIETASLFIENTLTLWIFAAGALVVTAWPRITTSRSIVVLVLLSASAMSKLHGVVAAAVIGTGLLIGFMRTRPDRRAWGTFAAAAVAAMAFGALPYVHAWIATGDPVFPYFNNIFRSPYWPPEAFVDTRWVGRFGWRLLWDATFNSGNYVEGYNGVLGVGLALLLPVALVVAVVRRSVTDVLIACFGFGIFVLIGIQIQYLRYFYFAFPFLFVMIGIALNEAFKLTIARHLAAAAVAVAVLFNFFLMPSSAWVLPVSDFRAVYNPAIRRDLEVSQAPERIANQLINQLGGRNTRVFYTETPFTGLLNGMSLSATWYATSFGAQALAVKTPADAETIIRQMQVDFVVHVTPEATAANKAFGEYLAAKAQDVGRIGKLTVYRIKPQP